MLQSIAMNNGEVLELGLGGGGMSVSREPARFELVMCARGKHGKIEGLKGSVYRGNKATAVEATFLKRLTKKEKGKDVYKVPSVI